MKKEEFLKILLDTLKQRGLEDDAAKRETEHVRTYLTESGMEELDISADEMADGIMEMLKEPSDDDSRTVAAVAVAVPADSTQGSVSDELNAAIAAIDADKKFPAESEKTSETSTAEAETIPIIPIVLEPELEEMLEAAPEDEETEPEEDPTDIGILLAEASEEDSEPSDYSESENNDREEETEAVIAPVVIETENLPATEEQEEQTSAEEPVAVEEPKQEEPAAEPENAPEPVREEAVEIAPEPEPAPPAVTYEEDDEENAEIEEFIPYEKKRRMRKEPSENKTANEWLYVLLLVITIPLSVAIILIAFALYLGFWVALALLMIACIAILIVFVTAGAVVSLVGIVFGVVELITGLVPVGLYEIGLGVTVGAGVMFVGILLYNFAVRFIPFGMKLLAKLFRSGFRAVRSGYQSLKGAVAKI